MIDLLSKLVLPVVTFLIGAWLQSFRTQHSEDIGQLNELIDEIKEARDLATDYWATDPADTEVSLSVKVRSCLHLIFAMAADAHLDALPGAQDALDGLYGEATGGTFETADRKADLGKALEIRIAAADLISLLRRRRRQINSWVYLPAEALNGVRGWLGTSLRPYELGRATSRWTKKLFGSRPKE